MEDIREVGALWTNSLRAKYVWNSLWETLV